MLCTKIHWAISLSKSRKAAT